MRKLFWSVLLLIGAAPQLQAQAFREGGKWGMKDGGNILLQPVFDTVFNFDSTSRVCLACQRQQNIPARGGMKISTRTFTCRYYNKSGEPLRAKIPTNDTCSVFTLLKNTPAEFYNNSNYFVATVKTSKFLFTKDFTQITFKPYLGIGETADPAFFTAELYDEYGNQFTGLINKQETVVIPHRFTGIRVNASDSLIIGCSAGYNADDVVYNFAGKEKFSSRRHIHSATRLFIIFKIFEPKEYFTIHRLEDKLETKLECEDLVILSSSEASIRIRKDRYLYNLNTGVKTRIK